MSLLQRRPLILLLWLALAWLPLRGLAQVTMHLPAADAHAATATAAEMPCHGSPADDAAAHADSGATACSLCDLCHGGALPPPVAAVPAGWAPPQVATEPRLHGLVAPPLFDRPPRA